MVLWKFGNETRGIQRLAEGAESCTQLQTLEIYGPSLYGQRVTVFTGLPSVTNLKGHEFVVWFWGPGVHLHTILQSNHQELYLLVAHYRKKDKRAHETD